MIIPITSIDQHGWVPDIPPHRIPINAWSIAVGARFMDGCAFAREGFSSLGTPPTTPVSLFTVGDAIITCGPSAIYRGNTNISRTGGYTGGIDDYWIGGPFNNWLVITNGVDVPQVLDMGDPSASMQNMPAWPGTYRAKVIRPFKNFLMTAGIKISGQPAARMVKWSHPADPGTLPSSWDHTDPAIDAGEVILAEGDEDIVDMIQYYNDMFIFTSQQIWSARYSGGPNVFTFSRLSSEVGILGPGCFADVPGIGLVVMTFDDILAITSGWQSIVDSRVRTTLFSSIDPFYYHRARLVVHPTEREMWVIFPSKGASVCDRAFVWNYRNNTWAEMPIGEVRSVAVRKQAIREDDTIDSDSLECDEENTILCDQGPQELRFSKAFYLANDSDIRAQDPSAPVEVVLKRDDFSYIDPGKIDEYTYKRWLSMRLDAVGNTGAEIQVRVGAKMGVWSEEVLTDPVTYTIGLTEEVQVTAVGRLFSFRLAWSDPSIRLRGLFVELAELRQAL